MSEDQFKWITNHAGDGFGVLREADDFLHLEGNPPGASVTETYYFGFHIAEAAIHGTIYIWFHPNLGVVTAGTMVSQGVRPCSLAANYFDMHAYLKLDDHVNHATGALSFPGGGLQLTPIKPMAEWHASLNDKAADTRFDLNFKAAMPAAVRADQKHFDQSMHVTGSLRLRGTDYVVDCYEIRDRSWQNARPEDPLPVPPYDWVCVTQGSALALNLSMFDDLSVLGNANGALHLPPKLLQDGWVYTNGTLRRIVSAEKRTERNADVLLPLRHEIRAVDEDGKIYDITGETIGSCNWNGWPNMLWHQCLTQWTCNGAPAMGEVQEVQWHDAVRLLRKIPLAA